MEERTGIRDHACRLENRNAASLTGVREKYPVISAAGVREADGTLTTVKECGEALNDYRSLEYYLLFDYGR